MSGTADAGAAAGGGAAPGAAAPVAHVSLLGTPPAGVSAAAAPPADTRAWLPEAYRADATFADLKDLDGLAKSYKHAASLVGVDRNQVLRIPQKADAPEWGDVWARLGRPEKPDGYQFAAPAGVDEPTLAGFRKTAHELGINSTQAAKLMEFYGGSLTAMQQRQADASTIAQGDVSNALKREWGQAFDDQLHAARRAVREVGGEGMVKLLEDTKLGDHPDVIRMFAKIGMSSAEASALKGGGGGLQTLTPANAQAEIKALQGDMAFGKALSDRSGAGYAAAKERWDALHRAAYPPEAAR